MKKGDRVIVTETTEIHFCVGDKATLTHQDSDGDWWADFDERHYYDGDSNMCLERGYSKYKLIEEDQVAEFSFANNADGFIHHISKSIPGYDQLVSYIVEISKTFAVKDTDRLTGVDLGASTGELVKLLSKEMPDGEFEGYDCEPKMVENKVCPNVYFLDVVKDPYPYSQIFYSIFTLQFLRNSNERETVIKKVYEALPDRGVFIVAEKVMIDDVLTHDILRNAQLQYKRKHFTDTEILDKENTLRRIMRPVTDGDLYDELASAGFDSITPFWRSGLFVAYMCIKG